MKHSDDLAERMGRMAAAWPDGVTRPADAPCPDSAALAEWLDSSPGSASRAALDNHLASCQRCQQVMAALASAEPPEPGVRPFPATARRRRFLWSWLLPAAATTAAAVIWFIVRPPIFAPPTQPIPPGNAERTLAVGGVAQAPPPTAGAAQPVGRPSAGPDRPQAGSADQSQARLSQAPPNTSPPSPPREGERALQKDEVKVATPPLEAPPPAAVLAGEAAMPERRAQEAPTGAAGAEAKTLGRSRLANVSAAPSAMAARLDKVSNEAAAGALIVISAADHRARWRLAAGGTVERTIDAGATWVGVDAGVGLAVLAGSAPTAAVCWLVGRHGLVLRSRDGHRFEPIAFPADVDLVAVEADDAQRAVVTSADGQVYRTDDGGSSWRR